MVAAMLVGQEKILETSPKKHPREEAKEVEIACSGSGGKGRMKTDSAWKQFLGRRVRMWDPMWDGLNPFYRFYFGSSWAVFRGLVMMSLVFSSFALGALAMGLAVQTDLIFEFLIGLAATWSISTMLFSILPSKKKVARTSSNPVTVSDGGRPVFSSALCKRNQPPRLVPSTMHQTVHGGTREKLVGT